MENQPRSQGLFLGREKALRTRLVENSTLFCIQCSVDSKDSLPSSSFSRGRNAKRNRKFPEFPNFEKKDNLERWTEIFETIFRKLSVPFDFEPEFPKILVEWNAPTNLDLNESPTKTPHSLGQKRQNAQIPHLLGTQRAANMVMKPH